MSPFPFSAFLPSLLPFVTAPRPLPLAFSRRASDARPSNGEIEASGLRAALLGYKSHISTKAGKVQHLACLDEVIPSIDCLLGLSPPFLSLAYAFLSLPFKVGGMGDWLPHLAALKGFGERRFPNCRMVSSGLTTHKGPKFCKVCAHKNFLDNLCGFCYIIFVVIKSNSFRVLGLMYVMLHCFKWRNA